jgi:hypothetical protein
MSPFADMASRKPLVTASASDVKEKRSKVSDSNDSYDVQVDWTTVAPMGDTLAISTTDGLDDRWVEAFEVVLDEHERQSNDRQWSEIDFKHTSDEKDVEFVVLVREIEPGAQAFELRRTIDDLVKAANIVAQVGTHVYELARELRQPEPATSRSSSVPPPFDPLADALDANVA